MPIEIPPGDDGLRSHVIKLTMRVTLNEAKVESMDAKIASFMTPQQIEAMNRRIADETVRRVEALLNGVTSQFGEIQFSASQVQALTEQLNGIAAQLTQRSAEAAQDRNAAIQDRTALNAVVRFINTLAADDVTNPDSKKTSKSWFERMEESIKTSDERSLSAALEVSQWRVDNAESTHELKDGIAAVKEIAAELKPHAIAAAQNAQRWKGVQDALKAVLSNPKLLLPTAALFGGGAIVTPEVLKVVWNVIVSIFTGAN